MSDEVQEYRGKNIAIRFDGAKCIHSRNCVLGRTDVFVPNAPGDWIQPDGASAEEVAAIARACPSGAITYERLDGAPDEAPPPVNVVRVRENGPLAFHGDLEITAQPSMGAPAERPRPGCCAPPSAAAAPRRTSPSATGPTPRSRSPSWPPASPQKKTPSPSPSAAASWWSSPSATGRWS